MLRRPDPPQLVSGLLALVLGLQLAWIVTGQFGAHDPLSPAPSDTADPARELIEQIREAHLFGQPQARDPSAVSPTALNLQLAGVLAEADPAAGQAIIGEGGGNARVYSVGASLPGGARLSAVYPDRIHIERAGVTEYLALPQRPLGSLAPAGSASPVTVAGEDLTALLRWQVVMRPGRSAGVRVYPGNDPQIFDRLGLRAGDLVLAINDVPLADPANAEQFLRSLTGSPESVLTVERDGREERLSVNIASVLAAPLT